jgi:hypothetical protein
MVSKSLLAGTVCTLISDTQACEFETILPARDGFRKMSCISMFVDLYLRDGWKKNKIKKTK